MHVIKARSVGKLFYLLASLVIIAGMYGAFLTGQA